MFQPGKRLRPPGDEFFGDSGEPLSKRRAHLHDRSGQEADGHGVPDDPALPEDFSVFFADDDLDALLPNLGHSTEAVDDFIDESLFYHAALVGTPGDDAAANAGVQPPPSSVVRAFDRASSSAGDFDPSLLHSPPKPSSIMTGTGDREPPDLPLTQEPDWESVRRDLEQFAHPSKGTGPSRRCQLSPAHERGGAAILTPAASAPCGDSRVPARPEKASSSKPYRTFFHLKEMVQGKLEMYRNQPLVEFEWYARVLYSSRENFGRKQYFQFRDLFKETPPYLSGALLG